MKDNQTVVRSSFWANLFKGQSDKPDLLEILQNIPFFVQLSNRDLNAVFNLIHDRSYIKDEYIFHQGDPGIGLYIIREGEVKIERKLVSAETISLAKFKTGDFFGELALLDDEKRSASAIAESEVKLAVIFKPDLDEFISHTPKRGIKILQGISHVVAVRLREVNEENIKLHSLIKQNSESKYGT